MGKILLEYSKSPIEQISGQTVENFMPGLGWCEDANNPTGWMEGSSYRSHGKYPPVFFSLGISFNLIHYIWVYYSGGSMYPQRSSLGEA